MKTTHNIFSTKVTLSQQRMTESRYLLLNKIVFTSCKRNLKRNLHSCHSVHKLTLISALSQQLTSLVLSGAAFVIFSVVQAKFSESAD